MEIDLEAKAHHIGYEWAMMLGACRTEWHVEESIAALNVSERDPLRVVHLHSRTELVWLHARVLYGFLFVESPRYENDLRVKEFLTGPNKSNWNSKSGLCAEDLCYVLKSQCVQSGGVNARIMHATTLRITDPNGLPDYTIARDELQRTFTVCYGLMESPQKEAFFAGLNHEWDVAKFALSL